jgi:hypothetical protein
MRTFVFILTTISVALVHRYVCFVVAVLIWLGEWEGGPQSGEVSRTPEERRHYEANKPYLEAFKKFLYKAMYCLSLPFPSYSFNRGHTDKPLLILNDVAWGLAAGATYYFVSRRRDRKRNEKKTDHCINDPSAHSEL